MKRFIILGLVVSSFAFAIDLNQATNQQLLQEVGRRLGSPTPGAAALGTFLCDDWGELKADFIAADGTVGQMKLDTGDTTPHCQPQAKVLQRNRARIAAFTQFAVCDNWGELYRYSVNENAKVVSLGHTRLTNFQACVGQANIINEN